MGGQRMGEKGDSKRRRPAGAESGVQNQEKKKKKSK